MIRLTRDPIDYDALTESVRRPDCGAVVTFLGTVRDLTGDRVTVALDYEAYGPMAEKKLAEIEADVRGALAGRRRRPGPPARPARSRRGRRGRGRELPAPRRGVRRLPVRHRPAQGTRADLEERELVRRLDRVGPPFQRGMRNAECGMNTTSRRPLPLASEIPQSEFRIPQLMDGFGRVHNNLRVSRDGPLQPPLHLLHARGRDVPATRPNC